MYDNDIETTEQLTSFKRNAKNNIEELTTQRKQLYKKDDSKDKIAQIDVKLRALRKDVRMCNGIMTDVEIIKEHHIFAESIEKEGASSSKIILTGRGMIL